MYYSNIPNNPMMLLSFINTKLRDEQMNLDELCYDLELRKIDIEDKLRMIGYIYNETSNKFV